MYNIFASKHNKSLLSRTDFRLGHVVILVTEYLTVPNQNKKIVVKLKALFLYSMRRVSAVWC